MGGMSTVLVTGATGFIGRRLVPALLDAGHDVRAMTRRPESYDGPGEPVGADVSDRASLDEALRDVDVAIYLVHSLDDPDFERKDAEAARTFSAAAAAAGVKQIVYMGGLGDDAEDLSPHLRSRAETGRALAGGDVPLTTLRAAIVVGRGSAGFETIVALVDRLPVMIAPKWVSMPTQPIALEDVVGYLAGVAGQDAALGETFDLGGPDVLTYRDMIERIGRLKGKRPHIIAVPVLSPRLSSYWLHLVTPVRASVSRPLVEGLRNPTVARDDRIRSLLPRELIPFDEAARAALAPE